MSSCLKRGLASFLKLLIFTSIAQGESLAERGYCLLTNIAYLPADFCNEEFDELWTTWETPLREKAAGASPKTRRQMAFAHYGLTPRDDNPSKPRQYVVDDQGNWCMSCLACHQGKVAGRVVPGVPNSLFALETLSEEVRLTKLRLGRPLGRMDKASLFIPLGTTIGTTNAVIFGVGLMAQRDADLNVVPVKGLPQMKHHDHDPPPLWQFHRKDHIYIDGFVPKSHRAIMQFLLVKQNGPEKFREWEDDFRAIYTYLESLRAPEYPFEVNTTIGARGHEVFEQRCAECHGTYGTNGAYPQRCIPIEDVGTDRVRLDALLPEYRRAYGQSWFARDEKLPTHDDPGGYVAPPLDGIWASAPYFHNGSVPTLNQVLTSETRPTIWRRTEDGFDKQQVGLEVEILDELPASLSPSGRRWYFDTRVSGKSKEGHTFGDDLSNAEKQALLEYLKTL